MITESVTAFPGLEREIKKLVGDHKKLKDEPLLLAIYYAPDRDPRDAFLFEIIENFGNGAVSSERELFEVTYNLSPALSRVSDQSLHLLLTNPREFELAVKEGWPAIEELRQAINAGKATVLYSAPSHGNLRKMVNA